MSRLVVTPRRIEFVILRTASSLPVALHPASQRRSYFQLRGHGLPRHGLPPCCLRAFTGALVPAKAGTQNWRVVLDTGLRRCDGVQSAENPASYPSPWLKVVPLIPALKMWKYAI